MIERKNEFVEEMFERMRWRKPQKLTYRATLMLQNNDLFLSISNKGQRELPSNLRVCMSFGQLNKNEMNECIVSRVFAEVKESYRDFVCVYTDASKKEERLGIGVWVPDRIIEYTCRLDDSICIMNGEIIAMFEGIKLGVNDASHCRNRKVIILSDSKVGMQMIVEGGGKRGNAYVNEMFEWLESLETGYNIDLQWIPSHMAIPGNERADLLADRGRMLENVMVHDISDGRDVLRVLFEYVWGKWVNEYRTKCLLKGKEYSEIESTPLRKPFFKGLKGDTRMIRTIERVRLNHGNWKECLYKRRLAENKLCERCMVDENIEHLILLCPKYDNERQMFNVLMNARTLKEVLQMGSSYRHLYEFIRMTGITI